MTHQKMIHKKTFRQKDLEQKKGKKAYRLRKQIQKEQQEEIKLHANK